MNGQASRDYKALRPLENEVMRPARARRTRKKRAQQEIARMTGRLGQIRGWRDSHEPLCIEFSLA